MRSFGRDECRVNMLLAQLGVAILLLASPTSMAEGQEFTVDANTVALYHFNEGSGSVAADASSNNYDGIVVDAVISSGIYSRCLSFTQAPQGFVDFGNYELPSQEGTVEMFIRPRPRSGGTDHSHVFVKGQSGFGGSDFTFYIRVYDDGSLDAGRGSAGSGISYLSTSPGIVNFEDSWQHIAFTWSSERTQWFVNGNLVAAGGALEIGASSHSVALCKWGEQLYPECFFEGEIDELRISNIERYAPSAICGDLNCDELVNITDAVYLIQYIFNGGPAPCDGCQ